MATPATAGIGVVVADQRSEEDCNVRTKNRAGLTAALTATIAAAALVLTGCTTGEPEATLPTDDAATSAAPSPSPTATEEAAPEYSPEEEAAIAEAKAAVLRFNEVDDAAFGDPASADSAAFDSVAIDPVRSDYNAAVATYKAEGLHRTGRSSVTFTRVRSVKTESNPKDFVYPKVTLEVCLDSSGTDLLDASGKSVKGEGSTHDAGLVGVYEEPGQGWFVERWDFQEGGKACAP